MILTRVFRPIRSDARRPGAGFTLVELLVVIAIIGTLVALLLPAVQSAREAARSNTCRNNVKQLVLAMTNYDSTQSKLPGLINEISNKGSGKVSGTGLGAGDFEQGRRASWLVMAFPYLESGPLWDRWNQDFSGNTSALLPELESFQCPSDPNEIPGRPVNSYVGNAGQALNDPSRGESGLPSQSAANREYAANGVFFDLNQKCTAVTGGGWTNACDNREANPLLQMSIDYIQGGDGTSKTMMVSENIHALAYTYPFDSSFTNGGSVTSVPQVRDAKHHFGFIWSNQLDTTTYAGTQYPQQVQRINGGLSLQIIAPEAYGNSPEQAGEFPEPLGYPSSNHPGGVTVGLCDGSVRFLSENIDLRVYSQAMTTKSKRSKYYDREVDTADRLLPPISDSDF